MPHTQRKRSETGFYHVVSKGDGGQVIFESNNDRTRYLEELESAAADYGVEVHAYCLMDNHVHLLVRDAKGSLSGFMKQLDENYARYFAWRSGRVGHVFQGRFWSEPIDCDEYFLSAMRYIHMNPEPPGICKARDYPWSSYRAYVGEKSFTTTELGLSLLGGKDRFEAFHEQGASSTRPFKSSALSNHLTHDELVAIAVSTIGRDELNNLRGMAPVSRIPYLQKLRTIGMTCSEITRITGLGRSTVQRALGSFGSFGDSPRAPGDCPQMTHK